MLLTSMEEQWHTDDFALRLRRQGWHMTFCKPVYSDPDVIMIRKHGHPLSIERGTAAWHSVLGENTVRKLLRAIVNEPRTIEELRHICGDPTKLEGYLNWFEQGEIVAQRDDQKWGRGAACATIDNFGPTLEWYVAEWFRSVLEVPARHGVAIEEVPRGGDLDVVAFVEGIRVFVECKTAKPDSVSDSELRWFLQRTSDFNPEIAVLLIDTQDSPSRLVSRLNAIFRDLSLKDLRLGNPNLPEDATVSPSLTEQPRSVPGLYWGARNVYVTSARRTIDVSLSAVLRLYHSHVRHLSFVGGDNVWDYVAGTVTLGPSATGQSGAR